MIFGRFNDYQEANEFKMEIADIISNAIRIKLIYDCDVFISRCNEEDNTYIIGLYHNRGLQPIVDKIMNLLENDFGIKRDKIYQKDFNIIIYKVTQETMDCIYLIKRLRETL